MNFTQIQDTYAQHVLPTYARYPVSFARGEGSHLFDSEGKKYIDFASGIGVNSVGYAHPVWLSAVTAQLGQLVHTSNLYYHEPGALLAERLCALSGLSGVFFSNSGAEANEGAVKVARKYSHQKYGDGRHTIVTLVSSFHGRTLTTLAATGQDVFHKQFQPLTEGFVHVPAGDLAALEAMSGDICAVMLEPVQGEGGVLPLDPVYLKSVEALCRERDWLLICDEVQTGLGRTGTWFAHQGLGLSPDVVTFAKGIAGGLPFGGFLTGPKARDVLQPGDHATTFGGGAVCCAAALATLDILQDALPQVSEKGQVIRERIAAMPYGLKARGMGLMLGVTVRQPPRELAQKLLDAGLVVLTAGADALRFLPPLTISKEDLAAGLDIFEWTLGTV